MYIKVVAAYVIAGGLRSTFVADYAHTVILFVSIFVFGFTIYATSDSVGRYMFPLPCCPHYPNH